VPAHFAFLWRIIQWAVIVILLLVSFPVLCRFGPNLKDRRWQWSIPGAVVAVTLWVAATLLLRVYQEHFSASPRIYGGLQWPRFCCGSMSQAQLSLIGGETNSEIEKGAAEAGHPDVREAGERRTGGDANFQKGNAIQN